MQGGRKKQNRTLSLEHGFIRDFDYKDYFKTDEGKDRLEEIYLLREQYFKSKLSKDKKSVVYEKLMAKKKELEEAIDEKIEFDDNGDIHVFTYTRE